MDYQAISTKTGLILVEVDGSGVSQGRTYTDKTTGAVKPLPGEQTAFIWQGGKYPTEVKVEIPQGAGPYAPGFYFLAGPIFGAGNYSSLSFKGSRELRLVECGLLFDSIALGDPKAKAA